MDGQAGHASIVIEVSRLASVRVFAERVLTVIPRVVRGERNGLNRLTIDRETEGGVDAAAGRGIREAVADDDCVGAGAGGEFHVLAGGVQFDALLAGRFGFHEERIILGAKHGAGGDHGFGLISGPRHIGAHRSTGGDRGEEQTQQNREREQRVGFRLRAGWFA